MDSVDSYLWERCFSDNFCYFEYEDDVCTGIKYSNTLNSDDVVFRIDVECYLNQVYI
jgi:hypothetical protein